LLAIAAKLVFDELVLFLSQPARNLVAKKTFRKRKVDLNAPKPMLKSTIHQLLL